MEKNQNDQRNQQSDSKSNQQLNQDGSKKKETNPDNPTTRQGVPQPGDQPRKDTGSTQGKANQADKNTDDKREETTDESTFGGSKDDSGSKKDESQKSGI